MTGTISERSRFFWNAKSCATAATTTTAVVRDAVRYVCILKALASAVWRGACMRHNSGSARARDRRVGTRLVVTGKQWTVAMRLWSTRSSVADQFAAINRRRFRVRTRRRLQTRCTVGTKGENNSNNTRAKNGSKNNSKKYIYIKS